VRVLYTVTRFCTVTLAMLLSIAALSFGQLEFDGVDSEIQAGTATQWDGASALTLSAWVSNDSANLYDSIICCQNAGNTHGFAIDWRTATTLGGFVFASGGLSYVTGTGDQTDGSIYHVVVVWDGADGGIDLYINGVLTDSDDGTAGTGTAKQNTVVRLGNSPATAGRFWAGDMYKPQIFTKALTAAQVANLYRTGAYPSDGTNRVAPVAEWGKVVGLASGDTLTNGTAVVNTAPSAASGTDGIATNGVKIAASVPSSVTNAAGYATPAPLKRKRR